MSTNPDWKRSSKLCGDPVALEDEAIRSPIRHALVPAFEVNVRHVMDLIFDLGLPSNVSRRRCDGIDGLEHYSLIVIQTAAARVEMEHLLKPKEIVDEAGNVTLSITAEQIRLRLARLGLSQQEFAMEAGYSPTRFSNYMTGRVPWPEGYAGVVIAALLRLEGALR